MRYSGITKRDRELMLDEVGVGHVDDLFSSVPDAVRMKEPLAVKGPLPEATLKAELDAMKSGAPRVSLVGGGLYHHYLPEPVSSLAGRSEWVTAYTPYQPELSQGTLIMYYEFQTYVCMLTGQEIANGGMYDGSTALAEAVMMARRVRKDALRLYVSEAVHPEYRQVLRTYLQFQDVELLLLAVDPETGRTQIDLTADQQKDALAIVVQSPNFFGVIEDVGGLEDDAFVISVCAEAQSLALVEPPRADIAVGEMQSLGIPVQLGGPTAGFFATSKAHVRNLPGRLVGKSVDAAGREAYCITLATREQFIRREKATSNICTSSGLMCLRSVIYLSLLGREGLQTAARQSARAAHAFAEGIEDVGLKRLHSGPFFNEFVVDAAARPGLFETLQAHGFVMGIPLAKWWPKRKDQYLVALTELHYPKVLELVQEVKARAHDS
ncbi:MAG: aminomethyl-transferring glycine dehydrogenase [Planctomycetes bacterium]|nr:aminomethyl-transferring glycine dehydrogenase [Planctomycetota bacterium]